MYADSLVAQWGRICLQCRRCRFHSWVRKILWRRKWQPTPVFLPGKIPTHGVVKDSDMIERLNNNNKMYAKLKHFAVHLKLIQHLHLQLFNKNLK